MTTAWHFLVMIFASMGLFYGVILITIGKQPFRKAIGKIVLLSLLCVVAGMLMGKSGANWGLPWWLYYTLPLLLNTLLPPIVLKMNTQKLIIYLLLSFLSAPVIHVFFSFFLNWHEYMPFWKIPSLQWVLQ